MPETLFLEERRYTILDKLNETGRVSVKDLSESLSVSAVTIRQDLQALENEGLLKRTYGGAVSIQQINGNSELSFDIRKTKHADEKQALGGLAASLIQDGYGIALDASTTVCSIIPYLTIFDSLTVVTNNLLAVNQLLDIPRAQVLLPAGTLRREGNSIIGNPGTLPDLNLTIGFFSAWGVSAEAGFTEVSPDEMAMKQALMSKCLMSVILVDHSKWGKVAPYTYADYSHIDRVITSNKMSEKLVQTLKTNNIPVDVAKIDA